MAGKFFVHLEDRIGDRFRALGTRAADKKHILYDTGHMPAVLPMMKDTLDWFDHCLGPVK